MPDTIATSLAGSDEPHPAEPKMGEMERLIRSGDWSNSPIGPLDGWPQSLKTAVGLILPAAAQIVLFWGPEFVALYNDAYAPTIGDKHPRALGRPAAENWTELWDDLRPLLQSVRDTGETVYAKDRPFYIERHGYPETVYFDISYSAVPDESGGVGGILCIVSETTERVLAEKGSLEDRERLTQMFEQSPTFTAVLRGSEHVIEIANPAYQKLIGNRDVVGKTIREALPEISGQGFFELLDEVFASGEPYVGLGTEVLIRLENVEPQTRFVDFVYQPLVGDAGKVTGILVQGSDVTERKRAEEQLRESDERLRLAVENAEIGFWDVQESHGELTWPSRTKAMFGISADVLVTMEDFFSGLHPDDRARVTEAYEAAADPARRSRYDVEYRTIGKEDGVLRWVAARGRGIFDREGPDARCIRVAGTAIDITLRKKAEEALRESDARLRAALEASESGTFRWDFRTNTLDWDEALDKLFGLPPGETARSLEQFVSLVHPDDRAGVIERCERCAADGADFEMEFRVIWPDERVRWVYDRGKTFFDDDGTPAYMTGACVDITERKLAGEALGEETHNLEILNRSGAAIAGELDLDRVVQMVTDAGVELTGAEFGAFFYNIVEPGGESYMLYTLSGVDRSAFENFPMPRNTKVFGPTFSGEGVVRSDDITTDPRYGQNAPYHGKPEGHLPVTSYLAVPVSGREGEVIGGLFFGHSRSARFEERHERLMEGIAAQAAIAIDNARLFGAAQHEIEQRVRAEQALTALNETLESRVAEEIARRSQAEEALRQSQKMETVGQLSGGIAHDFNNLLQVIHGNLSLLDRAIPDSNPKLRRSVTNALSGTERAAALTKRLLAFSRRQPLDARPIDVNRLILDMTELLHRTLGETITIETRLSGDVSNAFVDPNQLENAILNLAINARDAMSGGGRLEIGTTMAELDRNQVESNPDAPPGRYVRIQVRDTGHGMSEDVLSRAVEPFFSTKEVGQGTGLGLSMVYGFVRQSGGHLVLNSREGSGTTIELYLPCSSAAASVRTNPDSESELPAGCGERVLLCEDDEDVRFFSGETLRDLGYNVLEARDAESALALLSSQGRIDLLFTDVVLPGGQTGADLAREARKLQPDLKVLFTTGYARSALDRERGGESGVQLLLKPFGVEELAVKIRQILAVN